MDLHDHDYYVSSSESVCVRNTFPLAVSAEQKTISS